MKWSDTRPVKLYVALMAVVSLIAAALASAKWYP